MDIKSRLLPPTRKHKTGSNRSKLFFFEHACKGNNQSINDTRDMYQEEEEFFSIQHCLEKPAQQFNNIIFNIS